MNIKDTALTTGKRYLTTFKWIAFGILAGMFVGSVSAVFARLIVIATEFRKAHGIIIYFLPLAGLFIVFYYRALGAKKPKGTNLVITAIREGNNVPVRMAPLIIVSTVITHLFGGSAGREGAALQVGGSLGGALGRLFHFSEKDRRVVIMCGMSASFSALFGTPMAAAILALEISTVGIMYYSALVPCVAAAVTARFTAEAWGSHTSVMHIAEFEGVDPVNSSLTILFSIVAAFVAILFVFVMHRTKHLLSKYIENQYLRVIFGSVLIIGLTLLVGDQTYNGTGSDIIAKCVTDADFRMPYYGFLLKILFTAITLGVGFQGGEIVPSLFIGASFGNAFGPIFGLSPSLGAAIGMACIFCGVTNCPIASMLICFEMFGFEGGIYYIIAVAISYVFSGYSGIYNAQKVRYGKYNPGRVDKNAE